MLKTLELIKSLCMHFHACFIMMKLPAAIEGSLDVTHSTVMMQVQAHSWRFVDN